MKMFFFNKRGDIELDELGKIILKVILLVLLIVIITVVISGEFSNQVDKIKGAFGLLS